MNKNIKVKSVNNFFINHLESYTYILKKFY